MQKEKSVNIFVFLIFIAILGSMAAVYYNNTVFRIVSYISEILIIVNTLLYSFGKRDVNLSYLPIVLVSVIVIANYILSPYDHYSSDLLKFFGYFCCYKYGSSLACKYNKIVVDKKILYLLIFVPLIAVAFFDNTLVNNAFFVTPNTFVYIGVSIGLLYLLTHYEKKNAFWIAWGIVAMYVLLCTSLGVIVAIFIAYIILNLKKTHLPYLILGSVVAILAILYIDIPVFVRFRDVFHIWSSMSSSELKNIQDVNFYEISGRVELEGERTDVSSSIWRVVQWTGIFLAFIGDYLKIPFGEGVGWCVDSTGMMPHNDFLLILVEYGAIVFSFIVYFIRCIYKRMKTEGMLIYFILPMFLYHLTENLIQSFPPNVVLYFVVGWSMCKFKNRITRTELSKIETRNESITNQ